MPKYRIKIHPKQRVAYIPVEVFEVLGSEAFAHPNTFTAVMYNKNTPLNKVIASLEITIQDLKLRAEG